MASYYLLIGEQQQGPYTEDQVRQFLSTKQVTEETYAWREGEAEWVPLSNFNLSGKPKLKIQPRNVEPSAPNPLVEAEQRRIQKEEEKFAVTRKAVLTGQAYSASPAGFMDRVRNAWCLMGASFRILWEDKTLLALPLFSTISAILVLIVFAVPAALFYTANPELLKENNINHPIHYVILFMFYFVNYTVIIFFNAALVWCAAAHMRGETCTAKDGLVFAFSQIGKILGWAAISATVGLLLNILDNAIRQRSEFLANLVRSFLGFAWTLVSFLALPALVVEKIGPIQALKSSVALLKKTWGEQLTGNVSFGVIFGLLGIPGILLLVAGMVLGAGSESWVIFGLFTALAVLYFIVAALVQSAVRVVYQTALYLYARDGAAPAGFEEAALAGSIATKA